MAPVVRREQVQLTDTIFAVSSGRPPAAIAVIRVSGPNAFAAVKALCGSLPPPRAASLRTLRRDGKALDTALVLRFPGPASATGEDLAELHCHGGRAVIRAVEAALATQPGLRQADPGEFTRRALSNGRMDLMEAEGLADLLEAETEGQRVAAMAATEGRLSAYIRGWLDRLALLSARIEALLDYAEEDDVTQDYAAVASIRTDMSELGAEIHTALASPSVERLQSGVRVVIAGPPNAGKSTLLNRLVEREAAIVSPIAGTTRDVVEASVVRAGLALTLVDTAGLTSTADFVEAIGVKRAGQAIDQADLLVWLGDEIPPRSDAVWVHARADAPGREHCPTKRALAVSASDRRSIEALWALIDARARGLNATSEDGLVLHDHQRLQCQVAADALRLSISDPLLVAENLASARRALSNLLGINATEVMLDALFGRFCLGK